VEQYFGGIPQGRAATVNCENKLNPEDSPPLADPSELPGVLSAIGYRNTGTDTPAVELSTYWPGKARESTNPSCETKLAQLPSYFPTRSAPGGGPMSCGIRVTNQGVPDSWKPALPRVCPGGQ
jgi:hypothetical protein